VGALYQAPGGETLAHEDWRSITDKYVDFCTERGLDTIDTSRPATSPVVRARATPLQDARPMIVVLPFENLGPPEQAYFAAGMSEAITSRLARIAELGVISRSSALQYAGGAKSIRQMGEELGVDWVLEGTVLWAGERVRITQQLIRVTDDTHVWAEDYDRLIDVANLIDIQAEVAEEVSRQLGLSLFETPESAGASLPTASMDAYHAYLRRVEAWERPFDRNENLLVAAESLETAVEHDPGFAPAWALLSQARTWRYALERTSRRLEAARTAAERARDLDPELPETHSASYAAVGRKESALDMLEDLLSIPAPFSVVSMESDPAFASLRDHPRYQRLVERYQ